MQTRVDEIAESIYRISTYVPDVAPPAGFTLHQFLVDADEPRCATARSAACCRSWTWPTGHPAPSPTAWRTRPRAGAAALVWAWG